MMTTPTKNNLAIPNSAVFKYGDGTKLAIESNSWTHLIHYMECLESLPLPVPDPEVPGKDEAEQLRPLLPVFGTPQQLRITLQNTPNLLKESKHPKAIYDAIIWLIQRTGEGSSAMLEALNSITKRPMSSEGVQSTLLKASQLAQSVLNPIADILSSIDDFKAKYPVAHQRFSANYQQKAAILHSLQENVGSIQAQIDEIKRKINSLGFFNQGKKHELSNELNRLGVDYTRASDQAEKLRTRLSLLEPMINEGNWLEPGLNDLRDFCNKLRTLWVEMGSNMAQLAIDASDAQLQDPTWLKSTLGDADAIRQWMAIQDASFVFVGNATRPS